MDKQTEFYAHMCECNCFESEISVTELYDLQDSNIHLHLFKICVYTGSYDTITIILSKQLFKQNHYPTRTKRLKAPLVRLNRTSVLTIGWRQLDCFLLYIKGIVWFRTIYSS